MTHDPSDEDQQCTPPFTELLSMEQQERLWEPGDVDQAFIDAEAANDDPGAC